MFKYIGFIIRAIPYLILNYWTIFKNAVFRKRISLTKRYQETRRIVTNVNKKLKIEIISTGLKKLPVDQSFVMTPNHQSFMDALCMIQFMDQQCTFVAKKETKNFILVGKVFTALEGLYLDRDNLRQEIKVMQEVKKSLKTENKKWLIFPEGTRTKDQNLKMGEFKPGAIKMAMSAGVNIYPVAIWGTYRVLSTKYNMKKFPVFIHVFDPITPEIYKNMKTTDLAPMIQKMIEDKQEELKILDQQYCEKIKKNKCR